MDGKASVRENTATRQTPRTRLHLWALVDRREICTGCPMHPPTLWADCPHRRRSS